MITASPMDGRTGLALSVASYLVRTKKVSPVELTHECLSRIERLNPKLNAFITVTADSAVAEARQALKDLVDTAGVRTTAATGVFKDRVPTGDGEIVRHLKAADAVFLGKLNLQECAYGGSSAISYFGPVRNPWNLDYSPGGSSGGSAAAVAARLCFAAIGTETGEVPSASRQPTAESWALSLLTDV
jgi:aspartyl-tRNA(Asn)/glutamyl-tRNA(Gln) amidotransferase subunit A